MSEKKYPYIGDNRFGQIVLIYGKDSAFHISGQYQGEFSDAYNETGVRNITREYLANTYGKCESQEHADFICKLAENAGFRTSNDYDENLQWFCSSNYRVAFYEEFVSKSDGEKLIHLPLPPKEKEMPEVKPAIATISPKDNNPNNKAFDVFEVKETANAFEGVRCSGEAFHCYKDYWGIEFKKPVYTKEMHERGEYPPIGSKVKLMVGYGVVELGVDSNGFFPVLTNGKYQLLDIDSVKPITTIEDELFDITCKFIGKEITQADLVYELLDKYSITPKGE